MMKILVVCQYYYPEPLRITDICEQLVIAGHEVTVITGYPNYPMGDIYDGYKNKDHVNETVNGVKIHRCYTIPRKRGAIMRILNYYSFALSSVLYAKKIKQDYDVVFVNQLSPIMMANAGIVYKKKHHKQLILYCLDIWPESLTVGGIKKKSLIFKYFHKVSKKIYTQCDKILITSKMFEDYLKENFNIADEKIFYLPQYAEEIFDKEECKKINNNEEINLVFAGNIGKAQSIDTILEAANILKNNRKIIFHIIGDGSEYKHCCMKIAELHLNNIIMHGRKPLSEMIRYYKMADAMLITLSGKSLISKTLPGKIQSYMVAGKPIIGAANGETKLVIEEANCGFCGSADNADELAENIVRFINCENKEELGINSYKYYEQNYSKEKFLNKLVEELKKVKGEKINEHF